MKKFRGFLSVLCAFCITLAISAPAFAVSGQTTEGYAYMDIENASPELREKILAARCEIVYGTQAWTIGGVAYRILPDGSKVPLPEFSDLFPGWDPYEISGYVHSCSEILTANALGATASVASNFANNSSIGFDGVRNIPVASMTGSGLNFYSFTGDGSTVYAYAKTIPGDKYNIAIWDDDLKQDVAYEPNTYPGKDYGCILESITGHRYDCRVSSADKSGDSHLIVVAE